MRNPILTGLALVLLAAAAPAPLYHQGASIPGPDGQGWDFTAFDEASETLFVAHGEAVTVIDRAHGDAARSLGAISHGHAVVPLPDGKLAVTSGHDNTVRLFDVISGKELASIPVGNDPDAALIDPVSGHLLTMDAHGGTISEVDLTAAKLVRTLALKPGLEFPVIAGRMLYVNNEDENEIETMNLGSGKAGASIPLAGCKGPTGLALDSTHDRLIAACANEVAKVVSLPTGRVVQSIPIGKGPDAVLLDAGRKRALIPCGGSGTLEILSLASGKVSKAATVRTEPGARTGAIDARTGTVFLPTARFAPPAKQGDRPVAVPGSFHVVVLNPSA